MKIIANIDRSIWLIEASDYEIGNIMGEYSASGRELAVGVEIPVTALYQVTREIIQGQKELTEKAERFARTVNALAAFGAQLGPVADKIREKELKEK